MSRTKRDDFKLSIQRKLAERAGYMCSNPSCMRFTSGPCDADPSSSIKTAEAAHICAASPNGPRYDQYQLQNERTGANNGIWLCGACADLIDKGNGDDYSVPKLKRWKSDHEAFVKNLIESGFNPLRKLAPQNSERNLAQRLVHILEDKGVLFNPYQNEDQNLVIESLKDLRSRLTDLRGEASEGASLDQRIESMIAACRLYMNRNKGQLPLNQLEESLGALRKVFGIHLLQMREQFQIKVGHPLSSILPQR